MRPNTSPATGDQLITQQVQSQLRNDTNLSGTIGVETENSLVTLSGLVNTPEEADRAESDAWSVDGVADVENLLKVQLDGDF